IFVDRSADDLPPIQHFLCKVGSGVSDKMDALADFLLVRGSASAIIFCNTKSDTELVEVMLRRRGMSARRLNSDLSQSQRVRVMEKLHSGDFQYLVATDIAARGIDVERIELVV